MPRSGFHVYSCMMGFLISIAFVTSAFTGPSMGPYMAFSSLLYAFVIVPLLEWILPFDRNRVSRVPARVPHWIYDLILFAYVLLHFDLLVYASGFVAAQQTSAVLKVGMILSVGTVLGFIGNPVAHELVHSASWLKRRLGELIFVSFANGHFVVAHLHQHHRWVGTERDPESAEKDQSIYQYFFPAIVRSFVFAWRYDQKRVVAQMSVTVLIGVGLFLIGRWWGVLLYVSQAALSIAYITTVNYFEHYGLRRRANPDGSYEPVRPWHSWDSRHWITGKATLHLQRHADHHLHASRHFSDLLLHEKAPQLPVGYSLMILLALIPPLFKKIMNPRLEKALAWDEK